MKKMLTAKELIDYLDKKTSELEGDCILQQINKIDSNENLSPAEIINKMYELGYQRGMIFGKRDILVDIGNMMKVDESL
jgi:hypothetical protein